MKTLVKIVLQILLMIVLSFCIGIGYWKLDKVLCDPEYYFSMGCSEPWGEPLLNTVLLCLLLAWVVMGLKWLTMISKAVKLTHDQK
ncbi:hypothetical protein [Paraferrimonas sp. SM1919]|uniref:hypothetical protein n=1 Tax=Paraferrimonas sp. SM1919 TaxID=2662263 RepID=UPI0013D103F0|nr:hypothetical protein [Paraferrimonas sp. SM1919]